MKFSIIIPTYNRAAFLTKAIDSVLAQTCTDWELIVVDDGSTDNTREVVARYDDSRIRYIYQDNAERCAARNNGIEQARGEFVCFLDSDDSYLEDYLSDLSALIAKCDDKNLFVVSSMIVENNEGEKTVMPPALGDNMHEYFFCNSVPPSIVCMSRSLLASHRFDPRVVVSEDTKMWVDVMSGCPRVVVNERPGIKFLFHDDNTINVARRNVYRERQNTLKLILREDTGKKLRRKVARRAIDDCSFGIARHYFLNRRYMRACNVLFLSLLCHPANRAKEKMYLMYSVLINKRFC